MKNKILSLALAALLGLPVLGMDADLPGNVDTPPTQASSPSNQESYQASSLSNQDSYDEGREGDASELAPDGIVPTSSEEAVPVPAPVPAPGSIAEFTARLNAFDRTTMATATPAQLKDLRTSLESFIIALPPCDCVICDINRRFGGGIPSSGLGGSERVFEVPFGRGFGGRVPGASGSMEMPLDDFMAMIRGFRQSGHPAGQPAPGASVPGNNLDAESDESEGEGGDTGRSNGCAQQ